MQRNSTKNYEIFKQIGEGSYAKVYKAVRLSDNAVVAIKVVNITKMDKIMINSTLNEIRLLHSVNNDHVVGYFEAFMDASESNLWIVMEFMGGGDLACAIKLAKKENRTFPERVIWIYLIQLLRGLSSLNQYKVIHRDIKPANIFVTADHTIVKIGDLNVSKVVENDLTRTQIGTPSYLAPEIWEGRAYDSRCDIYSLGCCIYEMAALRLPFEAKSMEELKQKIRNNMIGPLPSQYSEELKKTIFKCLTKNPSVRPTAEKLLNSPLLEMKGTEFGIAEWVEDEKGRLMDTILFPSKVSQLSKMLPKKAGQPKRSSSAANLKALDSKNEFFSGASARKETGKSESKNPLNSSTGRSEAEKRAFAIAQKPSQPISQFQAVDVARANMSKNNSRQEVTMEVIDDRRPPVPTPMPVEPRQFPQKPLPPTRASPVVPNIDAFERIIQSDAKRPSQYNLSDRELARIDQAKKPVVGRNIPPSPATKIDAIKNNSSVSNKQIQTPAPGLNKIGSRNSSASAKKLEPVISEYNSGIKRQNSADRLVPISGSSSNRNLPSPVKSDQHIIRVPPKLPVKQVEKPLPPSANSFKKPPAKSMVNPVRQSSGNASPAGRYSTNPSNSGGNRSDSREIILKFDDFVKNFDESNNRMSKLRPRNSDLGGPARTPRYSSVRQKTRS
jgi:NIMA (never in mitosis gene a)-related kinase